jgi:NADH pyrophosphatase NudC (nudix superfamily)
MTIITPVPIYKECPTCHEEVEIWSNELKRQCGKCGTVVFKEDVPSCIQWCKYARECIGEERYKQLWEE